MNDKKAIVNAPMISLVIASRIQKVIIDAWFIGAYNNNKIYSLRSEQLISVVMINTTVK